MFDGDRMVGVLDGRHTMEALMVTGDFQRGEMRFTLPGQQEITVALYRVRAPKLHGSGSSVTAEIFLEADLLEPETLPIGSETLKAFLEEQIGKELGTVLLAQQRANSDAMGFGRLQAKRVRSASDWENYDWKADYRALKVTFSVTVMLSHNAHDPETE